MSEITKVMFEATSPTVSYGNIKTTVELEGGSWEEMRDAGLSKLSEVDKMVSSSPFTISRPEENKSGTEKVFSRLTGVTLNFDPLTHKYFGEDGMNYVSGSRFADQFYQPFDQEVILSAILKSNPDAKREDILAIWGLNNEASTSFGTAIHALMENYIKYGVVGEKTASKGKPNRALSKNPLLKGIVETYVKKYGTDSVISEEFIADSEGHCGRVDAIKIVDKAKKIIRIIDFKTDGDLFEKKYQKSDSPFKEKISDSTKLTYHRFQMSFYAYILNQYGYKVEGIDLDWLNPTTLEWERHSSKPIDLTAILKKGKK